MVAGTTFAEDRLSFSLYVLAMYGGDMPSLDVADPLWVDIV